MIRPVFRLKVFLSAALALVFGISLAWLPVRSASAQVLPPLQRKPVVGRTQGGAAPDPNEEGEDPFGQLARERWFQQQRAYPHTHIPAGAYWRAVQQREALVARHQLLFQSVRPEVIAAADPLSSVTWTPDGPQPLQYSGGGTSWSGRATSIAVHPTDPNTVYIGTAGGGVWKTSDGGQTWTPLTDSQASLAIGAVAIDPNNPNTIYAGTGEADFSGDSYYGQGLLKSTDAGKTWTLIRTPFTTGDTAPDFSQIVVQAGNSNVILAATVWGYDTGGGGVYRSSDGGLTWKAVLVPDPTNSVSSVMFDVKTPSIAYAGVAYGTGASAAVYKSMDGGQTWTAAGGTGSNILPAPASVARLALAEDSAGATLYASVALTTSSDNSGGTPGSIYKSTDGGANWTNLGQPSTTDGPDWYRNAIAVNPANSSVIYSSGIRVYHSSDGGKTWSSGSAGSGYYADQHAFVFSADGSRLYVADDGGILVTSDPADATPSFTSLNNTIGTMTFYPGFSINTASQMQLIAGSQDHGLDVYQGSLLWAETGYCGDGGSAYIDPKGHSAYGHCPGTANFSLWANSSGNVSYTAWTEADSGIDPNKTDSLPWVADIKGDWQTVSTIYTGTNYLYQLTNSGSSWTRISPDLSAGTGCTISTIAVSPSDSNTVYAGTPCANIWVTHNALSGAAATWTALSGLPGLAISKILVAPDSANDVYVTLNGFDNGHVFHSTNGGAAWTNISGDLPNTPVDSIVVDPDINNVLYLATDTGVYFTENGGTNWNLLGTGFPHVVAQDILMYKPNRSLHVITHGRGAWETVVPLVGLQASAGNLQFGNQAINTTSTALTVTLTNNQPSASLSLTGFQITGPFTQTNNCGPSLTAGSSCTISVTFTPNAEGALQGTLTASSSTNPVVVLLFGTGLSPVVSLSASSLTFGNQPVNTYSNYQYVQVTNTGNATLSNISVTFTGANPGDFYLSNGCGTTLTAGSVCYIYVAFDPTTGGARTATLSISDSAIGSPQTVALSGTGTVTPTITVTPSASSITTTQPLTVAVVLGATAGNPTPSGSVTLAGGGYTSAATTLTAGSANINISAGKLSVGNDTLSATYTPDSGSSSIYNSVIGSAFVTVVQSTYSCSSANPNPNPNPAAFGSPGDFNGDCRSDILWRNTSTGETDMWLMNGTGITGAANLGTISTNWTIAAAGDFNGDGKSDILWRNATSGEVDMWLMNGAGITSAASLGTIATNWTIAAVGDFNDDGKSDILWRNTSTGEVDLWLMNGTGITSAANLGTIAANWSIVGTGDFNGDGKADILWRNTSTGEVDLWIMNGTSITSGTNLGAIATNWSIAGIGDFNGNGKSDILWRNNSTGEVDMWLMNGTAIASAANLGTIATNWSIAGAGDFNGDGRSDILWRNTSTGEVNIWLMNGTGITSAASLGTIATNWQIATLSP